MPLSNAEIRARARTQKIDDLFRARHTKWPNLSHERWTQEQSVGRYHRVRCTECDEVINFLDEDLQEKQP